ncbi:hypothetical protein AQS8620_01336 [Aquimixticola soesokkakensis]|uniref:Uncharacterized protein n=1 Tax=Aquimixticola soesokkakensis TaxID=1519096 RepID=A0A1Y5SBL4_9RHOB|nr:hypothetical protein [Aquimixticola soesokkakensis]SLN37004.1 hypothetical protein AQS8620_01336 [Aquimixticola soesokkakensis]
MSLDRSFNEKAEMWSQDRAALALGMNCSHFRKKKKQLQEEGFPEVDHITKRYVAADVRAWIARRRKVRDPEAPPRQTISGTIETVPNISGAINYDSL